MNELPTNTRLISIKLLKLALLVGFGLTSSIWAQQNPPNAPQSTTKAQQSSSAARRLIVHIDDAGMCHSANVATMKCLESGASTSASIMMPCSWAPEFAEYAKKHPEFCYGIHFTLNCEWSSFRWAPLAGRDRVPSLVDEDGYMWGGVEQLAKHAKADEVELELRAQIELAKKLGVPISHFDTHMGSVMARPDLVAVYVKLALEYQKPILWLRKLTRRNATSIRILPQFSIRPSENWTNSNCPFSMLCCSIMVAMIYLSENKPIELQSNRSSPV